MRSVLLGSLLVLGSVQGAMAADDAVKVAVDEAHQKVDVTIGGKPFTAYVWPSTLKKPVLFPLVAAIGFAGIFAILIFVLLTRKRAPCGLNRST